MRVFGAETILLLRPRGTSVSLVRCFTSYRAVLVVKTTQKNI